MGDTMPLELALAGLICQRGGTRLFTGLSLKLQAGDVLAVTGPNGAGKTSLLRILAGFLPPTGGVVRLCVGEVEIPDAEARGKFVAWLGPDEAIRPARSLRNHLNFFMGLGCGQGDVEAVLAHVGLARLADVHCGRLSAGQRRRLGLARLMLCDRPLWLLDEPMALLDSGGRSVASAAIAAHAARGGIVIAAGHEPLGTACTSLVLGGGV